MESMCFIHPVTEGRTEKVLRLVKTEKAKEKAWGGRKQVFIKLIILWKTSFQEVLMPSETGSERK